MKKLFWVLSFVLLTACGGSGGGSSGGSESDGGSSGGGTENGAGSGTGGETGGSTGGGNLSQTPPYTAAAPSDFRAKPQVAASWMASFALDEHGDIWSVGSNSSGLLGIGEHNPFMPNYTVACTETAYEYSGDPCTQVFAKLTVDDFGQPLTRFKALDAGWQQLFAIDHDGGLWAAGYDGAGVLGVDLVPELFGRLDNLTKIISGADGQLLPKIKFVVTGNSTILIDENGALWGTGYNNEGELGLGDKEQRNHFTKIEKGALTLGGALVDLPKFTAVAIEDVGHAIAIDENGDL